MIGEDDFVVGEHIVERTAVFIYMVPDAVTLIQNVYQAIFGTFNDGISTFVS